MKAARFVFFGLVPLAILSCTSVAPVKITAGDQCFRCRRIIVDTHLAAETIQGSFVSKYRAPGCMAKYIAAHPDEPLGSVFVTDYASGTMIDPSRAFFVSVLLDRNTGETDYRAYRAKADADAAALQLMTTPVDWPTVLRQAQ